MTIRITGMNSGLDTESIITELASARSVKVQSIQKAQTKLSWKIDAWKSLNTKIYSLYTDTLSDMRLAGSYSKKATTVSNSKAVSVITGAGAVNGVQKLKINKLATAGYMTSGKITTASLDSATEKTKLSDLGISEDFKLNVNIGGEDKELSFTSSSTIADVTSELQKLGLNANFDTNQQRFYISSKTTGEAANFNITAGDTTGALAKLGMDTTATGNSQAHKIEGTDASITLNGVDYTSSNNTFEINGLTFTAQEVSDEEITVTTDTDTSGIYDMIKGFLTKYNALINEMDKLYNADSNSKYQPLTDDEKDAMSDKEVEKWEETIKESLLRRDSTLDSVSSAMKNIMAGGVKMTDGTTMYLSDFGIDTLSYFTAADNEKNAYHIDGDSDDSNTKNNDDKLKTAIANNTDQVVEFFSTLSKNLYEKLTDKMAITDYSSAFTVYNDKQMKTELSDYTTKVSEAQTKLDDYIDKWYSKFSAMETALAKLNSKQSAISGMLGS